MLYLTIIQIIILLCWGAFFLTWIGGAFYNFRNGPRISRGHTDSMRWWLIALLIVFVWLGVSSTNNLPELQIVGGILLIAATLFTLWSRLVLGAMWSSGAAVKSEHQLRADGPYRITRHPIYTGILGMLVGTTLVSIGVLPILAIFLAIVLHRIPSEERLMIEEFGEQYLEYKNVVPQLIPGLYLRKNREMN